MLVIADGSDGCYDLGGESDDEREEERRRGDATTVTGPGATPVGGTLGHSLAAPRSPDRDLDPSMPFWVFTIYHLKKCGNVQK